MNRVAASSRRWGVRRIRGASSSDGLGRQHHHRRTRRDRPLRSRTGESTRSEPPNRPRCAWAPPADPSLKLGRPLRSGGTVAGLWHLGEVAVRIHDEAALRLAVDLELLEPVPTNASEDLLTAVARLGAGEAETRAQFEAEPTAYRWIFHRQADDVSPARNTSESGLSGEDSRTRTQSSFLVFSLGKNIWRAQRLNSAAPPTNSGTGSRAAGANTYPSAVTVQTVRGMNAAVPSIPHRNVG
jgi:hypothetical protein